MDTLLDGSFVEVLRGKGGANCLCLVHFLGGVRKGGESDRVCAIKLGREERLERVC